MDGIAEHPDSSGPLVVHNAAPPLSSLTQIPDLEIRFFSAFFAFPAEAAPLFLVAVLWCDPV
jgi:hypothetical protein